MLDLFSGIGGFSLGLERAGGFETVAFCEVDAKARRVLAKHWPNVPIFEDIRTLTGEQLREQGIMPDVICGGFPCQDISGAGKGAGIIGTRSGLWAEMFRLIRDVRLKMYQPCDLRGLPWSYKISARSGICVSGIAYPLVPLARLTRGTGSGSWPTPCSNTRPNEGNVRLLRAKVEAGELSRADAAAMLNGKDPFEAQGVIPQKMWPTPTTQDATNCGGPSQMLRNSVPQVVELIGKAINAS